MQQRIAYIVRFQEDRVNRAVLAGVRRYARVREWDVETLAWDKARTGSPKALRSPPRPIGFIVEGSDLPPDLPLRLYGGAPVVFCNCPRAPRDTRFARLAIDEAAVARTAFRELSASLPSACAVVGYWRGRRNWSDDRATAFRAAAYEAGLPCHAFSFIDMRKADASGEPARLATWLASLPRHCAVFAVNDETAAVVAKAVRAALLDIPRDLTLLGADNDASICETSHPTLSSIQMDFENAGYCAARILGSMTGRDDCFRLTRRHGVAEKEGLSSSKSPASVSSESNAIAIGPMLAVRRESTMGRGRRKPLILEAVEMIRREACDGLTVAMLVKRFKESRRLFEIRFREAMGHSVLDEILHARMQSVHTLLADTDTPVGAIADYCGFRSDRALRKLFLSREKMSMTAWRQLHRR